MRLSFAPEDNFEQKHQQRPDRIEKLGPLEKDSGRCRSVILTLALSETLKLNWGLTRQLGSSMVPPEVVLFHCPARDTVNG